jgi:hypothetical protein
MALADASCTCVEKDMTTPVEIVTLDTYDFRDGRGDSPAFVYRYLDCPNVLSAWRIEPDTPSAFTQCIRGFRPGERVLVRLVTSENLSCNRSWNELKVGHCELPSGVDSLDGVISAKGSERCAWMH